MPAITRVMRKAFMTFAGMTEGIFSIYGGNIGGALRGLIEMRDGNNGENFQGTVADVTRAQCKTQVIVDVTADYL